MGFRKPVSKDAGHAGFSLIEVTVVVMVSLIVGAIAIPNMVAVISNQHVGFAPELPHGSRKGEQNPDSTFRDD
jgi:prepilin-type N-terminal cleavage/methylation domain-containing protein